MSNPLVSRHNVFEDGPYFHSIKKTFITKHTKPKETEETGHLSLVLPHGLDSYVSYLELSA